MKGPHHDVCEVQQLLQGTHSSLQFESVKLNDPRYTEVYGWDRDSFRILRDDNGPKANQPTLENIVSLE